MTIDQVTLTRPLAQDPVLHLGDPNVYWQVTGYNVYRSEDASPRAFWTQLVLDAADQDPAAPGIQWKDRSGDVSPTGIWFYQAAAYNGPCGAEGPW